MVTPPPDKDFPWWLVVAGGLLLWMLWQVLSDELYRQVLTTLGRGVQVTICVTVVGFAMATVIFFAHPPGLREGMPAMIALKIAKMPFADIVLVGTVA